MPLALGNRHSRHSTRHAITIQRPGSKKHSISLASLLIIEILHSPAPEHHHHLRGRPDILVWESDDEGVATVDQTGFAIGISAGTATIYAIVGEMSTTCEVTVYAYAVATSDYIDRYNENHGKGIAIGMTIWAPVNSGYHKDNFKYGKLYQWGRIYGQGYSGEFYDGDWDQTYSDSTVPTFAEAGVSEKVR